MEYVTYMEGKGSGQLEPNQTVTDQEHKKRTSNNPNDNRVHIVENSIANFLCLGCTVPFQAHLFRFAGHRCSPNLLCDFLNTAEASQLFFTLEDHTEASKRLANKPRIISSTAVKAPGRLLRALLHVGAFSM